MRDDEDGLICRQHETWIAERSPLRFDITPHIVFERGKCVAPLMGLVYFG